MGPPSPFRDLRTFLHTVRFFARSSSHSPLLQPRVLPVISLFHRCQVPPNFPKTGGPLPPLGPPLISLNIFNRILCSALPLVCTLPCHQPRVCPPSPCAFRLTLAICAALSCHHCAAPINSPIPSPPRTPNSLVFDGENFTATGLRALSEPFQDE